MPTSEIAALKEIPAEHGIYAHPRYINVCQLVYLVAGRLAWRMLVRNYRNDFKSADIEKGVHYVVVPNHQTYFDPWVIPGSLPLRYWRKMGWLRVFIANRFFGYPFVGNLMRSFGGFPARVHPTDPYGLAYAETLMGRGHTIAIFPEGGLSRTREKPAKHGVQVLAQMPNVRLVPVHIEWPQGAKIRGLDMHIGKPFDGSKMTAQEILDRVYSLPVD